MRTREEALVRYKFLDKAMETHRLAADYSLSKCKDHLRRIYSDGNGRCIFDDGERHSVEQIMEAFELVGVYGKAKDDTDFLAVYNLYKKESSMERKAYRVFDKFDARIRSQNAGTNKDWWMEYCILTEGEE